MESVRQSGSQSVSQSVSQHFKCGRGASCVYCRVRELCSLKYDKLQYLVIGRLTQLNSTQQLLYFPFLRPKFACVYSIV
jgi:hypothetical protein